MTRLVPACVVVLAACGGEAPSTASRLGLGSRPERSGVVPGAASGATRIDFVSADPAPGTALSGCGPDASGCPGRLRMVFRVTPSVTATAARFVATLRADSERPCFRAATGPLPLRAGVGASIQVVLDPSGACATPFAVTRLAADLEGDRPVAAHQEWAIGYAFAP